jgi:hypothetical protein
MIVVTTAIVIAISAFATAMLHKQIFSCVDTRSINSKNTCKEPITEISSLDCNPLSSKITHTSNTTTLQDHDDNLIYYRLIDFEDI